jgi:hypothetical protein
MAGVFGDDINNRIDFFQELARAKRQVQQLLTRYSKDPTLQSVLTQLEAIEQWTASGRTPTDAERGKIGMATRMTREFDGPVDPEIFELKKTVLGVDPYFRYWPDDTTASDPSNFDYLKYRKI